jgi:hypothetical protein
MVAVLWCANLSGQTAACQSGQPGVARGSSAEHRETERLPHALVSSAGSSATGRNLVRARRDGAGSFLRVHVLAPGLFAGPWL